MLLVHTVYNSTLTYPRIPLKTLIRDGWRHHGVILGLVYGVFVPCCWLFIYGFYVGNAKNTRHDGPALLFPVHYTPAITILVFK